VNEKAKKNIPEEIIPWITIKMEALISLLNDFIIKVSTISVM